MSIGFDRIERTIYQAGGQLQVLALISALALIIFNVFTNDTGKINSMLMTSDYGKTLEGTINAEEKLNG